ncbi:MAG: alpha-galactosidase [Actinomycetota bacterium]|nr:alpha-galactosidase [Actinomycetota bacterium]
MDGPYSVDSSYDHDVLDDAPRLRVRMRRTHGPGVDAPVTPGRPTSIGGLEVVVDASEEGELRWSVANAGDRDLDLDAVALVWDGGAADDCPRMFANGYQSWTPARTLRLGIDVDPSRDPRPIPLVRAAFHADPGVCAPGELRSEQVAVLASGDRARFAIGFVGGATHAGTIRVRIVDDRLELAATAWLGGATLRAGEQRVLHPFVIEEHDDPSVLLERWADRTGRAEQARVRAPFLSGWCSWYHYFEHVTERDVLDNLALADDWPFDVFQVDDGFQRAIGDWLHTNNKFPSGVEGVASAIRASGRTAGLWIAPFLAAPDSEVATSHPEWLARAPAGENPAIGMYHDVWGGVMWQLDTTNPEVVDHLAATAAALVDAGYRYLKLDFTFSASMPGRFADPTRTPAERVRAGYDAIRRGAGDDVFILGCGAPLGALVGAVDGMRIGADVAPWWEAPADAPGRQPAYEDTTPATKHAFVNTCTRSFMHRRLWSNDPDCIMLRNRETRLSRETIARWAETVGASGGLVLVSDDLSLIDADGRRLLDEVLVRARAVDAASREGTTPRALGLLDPQGPGGLTGS